MELDNDQVFLIDELMNYATIDTTNIKEYLHFLNLLNIPIYKKYVKKPSIKEKDEKEFINVIKYLMDFNHLWKSEDLDLEDPDNEGINDQKTQMNAFPTVDNLTEMFRDHIEYAKLIKDFKLSNRICITEIDEEIAVFLGYAFSYKYAVVAGFHCLSPVLIELHRCNFDYIYKKKIASELWIVYWVSGETTLEPGEMFSLTNDKEKKEKKKKKEEEEEDLPFWKMYDVGLSQEVEKEFDKEWEYWEEYRNITTKPNKLCTQELELIKKYRDKCPIVLLTLCLCVITGRNKSAYKIFNLLANNTDFHNDTVQLDCVRYFIELLNPLFSYLPLIPCKIIENLKHPLITDCKAPFVGDYFKISQSQEYLHHLWAVAINLLNPKTPKPYKIDDISLGLEKIPISASNEIDSCDLTPF